MVEMMALSRRKRESQGEGGRIWREKTWKGFELRRETKSIGSNGNYFCAVATRIGRSRKKKKKACDSLIRIPVYFQLFAIHRHSWDNHAIYVVRSTVIPGMTFCHDGLK